MSKENKSTVEIYEKIAHLYLATSKEHDRLYPTDAAKKEERLKKLIKESFSTLKKGSKILEIGSGSGDNAKFIKNLGFEVTASDTAKSFIEATKQQGLNTIKFNVIEDNFPEKYSGVFCWRVFVHFTKEDALKTIKKIYNNLENGGVFIFNAINREIKEIDSEWVDFDSEYHLGEERYYNYFRKEELDNIIRQTEFKVLDFHLEGGKDNKKWLVYVLKK